MGHHPDLRLGGSGDETAIRQSPADGFVHAYTDIDANNTPDAGSSPDGGASRDFNFALDLTQAPSTYRPAAVTNLFYWNNVLHDIPHAYGFDEAGGNFQVNNYGNGGLGNDAVQAEAQDGAGTNNANFGTPPDGAAPRMQMFVWTAPTPDRDGDFDNGIVTHEYGHGISNRLVGGPANVSCLQNNQQPGEGLGDWWALFFTQPEDTSAAARLRGIGTYALNQAPTGLGIREDYYDGDPAVNGQPQENLWTYSTISGAAIPHGVGSRWAQAYWQVTWALIDQHGFDADLDNYTGTAADAGNIRAMYYIIQGLKNTICGPAFTDVRDGVLAAAAAAYGAEDVCTIWSAFAEFGLGANAVSGGPDSTTPTNGFNVPTSCSFLFAAPPEQAICSGTSPEYNLRVGTSYTAPVTLVLTGHPAGTTPSYTVNPIPAVPGLSHLTLGNTAGAATGTYNMTLTANADAAHAQTLTLDVFAGTPPAPVLTFPANGAANTVLQPNFQWTSAAGQSWVLVVDDNADLSSPIYTSPVLEATSHQPPNNLPGNTQLFWRVTPTNMCGAGTASPVFSFTTVLAPGQCATGKRRAGQRLPGLGERHGGLGELRHRQHLGPFGNERPQRSERAPRRRSGDHVRAAPGLAPDRRSRDGAEAHLLESPVVREQRSGERVLGWRHRRSLDQQRRFLHAAPESGAPDRSVRRSDHGQPGKPDAEPERLVRRSAADARVGRQPHGLRRPDDPPALPARQRLRGRRRRLVARRHLGPELRHRPHLQRRILERRHRPLE